MPNTTRYREVTVSGSPREMGRQIGEAARDEVRGFCAVALERVRQTVNISTERANKISLDSIAHAQSYSPDMMEEMRGVAESAGVTLEDLMLLQVRNQLTPDADAGCTSLSIAAELTEDGRPIVAQNWDNDPLLDEFTVVLTRRPTGKPAIMTATQAGLISYLGFNDAGIGACVNTLPAPAREVGVPHYFTLRGIYESTSRDEAIQNVRRAHRAIPANIMLATPQGPVDLEVTIDDVYPLEPREGDGYITHTNHCLCEKLQQNNNEFPELIESHPRLARIESLMRECNDPIGLQNVMRILSDHQGHPKSICRHANDHPQHGFWTTVFSIVIQPTAGRMYVTRGNPCTQPFEKYELN